MVPLLYKRRVDTLESMVYELMDKFKNLKSENGKLKALVMEVKEENEALKSNINEVNQKQENADVTVKVNKKSVREIEKEYTQWKKEQDEETLNFKEIEGTRDQRRAGSPGESGVL